MEGYPQAAANFSKEANLQPQQEDNAITARRDIQHAIHTGRIEQAIEALNDLDPEVCVCYFYFVTPAMIRTRVSTCTTHRLRPVMRNNHQIYEQNSFFLLLPSQSASCR